MGRIESIETTKQESIVNPKMKEVSYLQFLTLETYISFFLFRIFPIHEKILRYSRLNLDWMII